MSQNQYAFVRSLQTQNGSNIKTFNGIKGAETHAKRQDLTSQKRQVEGRSHEANYFWSKAGEGLEGGGADYSAAYRQHKKDHGVKTERKGSALAQHMLVGVSPEWLAEGGDPHDISNPHVQQLIDEAKAWAESWMGEGSVWAVRYDTDEKGAGVVDILASPIREQKHKSGSSKPVISVSKANKELAARHGVMKSWEAMQNDWALHAQVYLDKDLKRGEPKAETKRENVSPEVYAAAVEKQMAETTRQLENFSKEISDVYAKMRLADDYWIRTGEERLRAGDADDDYVLELETRWPVSEHEYTTYYVPKDHPPSSPEFLDFCQKVLPEADLEELDELQYGIINSFYDRERGEPFKTLDWVQQLIRQSFARAEDISRRVREQVRQLYVTEIEFFDVEEAVTAREEAVVDAEAAFEAERERGYEEGRVEGLTEAAEALEVVEAREEAVSDREAAVAHAEDVSEAWEGLRVAPEAIVQAVNDRMSLFDTVGEVLGGLDLSDNAAYLEKVHPSERDLNGDPPPVRSLVFDRAQTLARKKNQLVADRHAVRGRAPS